MDKDDLKILLAYDGSNLALTAVNYIVSLWPADKTEVVLFHWANKTEEIK